MQTKERKDTKKGMVVMMALLLFIIISSVLIIGIVVPASNQIRSAREAFKSRQSYLAADSATEDALYRLNNGWTLPTSFVLAFSSGITSSAIVTTNAEGATEIMATGDAGIPVRSSSGRFSRGAGVSLNYTAQIGTGGITISSGTINGSVYSNGNIIMQSAAAIITGSATVANDADPVLHQSNTDTTTTTVDFGKTSALQDIAQGFQVSTTTAVSFVRVYLKKTGGVSDLTMRIVSNNGSNPGGTTLTTKTILASSVSTTFDYVPVPLSTTLTLTPGVQYWLVLDYGTNHNTKYYSTKVTNGTYANGVAKSGSWNASSGGTWSSVSPSNGDMIFDVYVGGVISKIQGLGQYNRIRIGTGTTGNAWAYEVTNADVAGNLYCQNNTYVYALSGGAAKSCTFQTSAPVLSYPISDANITEWKTLVTDAINAISGGWTKTGDLTIGYAGTTTTSLRRINGNLTINGGGAAVFGDLYVTGNLTVTGGATMTANSLQVGGNLSVGSNSLTAGKTKVGGTTTVTGGAHYYAKDTLWSVGNITLSGGSYITLDSSVGAADGLILTDGRADTSGGGYFNGSGTSGSYLMIASLSTCPGSCGGGVDAVNISGGSGAVIVYAPNGKVSITGGSTLKQVTAKELYIGGGSTVIYDSGLTNIDFGSGDSSSWVVENWDEVSG